MNKTHTQTHTSSHTHRQTGYHMNKTHTDTHMQKPDHTRSPTYSYTHINTHKNYRGDGQTSPHETWLVVSYSTCPPLSPCLHASSFVISTVDCNKRTHTRTYAHIET